MFALLLASFLAPAVLSDRPARTTTILIYVGALALALRQAQFPSRRSRRLRWVLLAGSAVVAVLVTVLPGRWVEGTAALWTAGVLLFTVSVVVVGVLRHRVVSMQTIFGALSAYLLLGFVFAALFTATDRLTTQPLFADGNPADGTAIQYFAFITLTTTGYGDLTPAGEPGRSLAVLDALVGQLFLATLVARLVAMFGTERRPPRDHVTPDD
jgi:uncharacterized membrane protein YgdD (TMEM256/DUF423 family)